MSKYESFSHLVNKMESGGIRVSFILSQFDLNKQLLGSTGMDIGYCPMLHKYGHINMHTTSRHKANS